MYIGVLSIGDRWSGLSGMNERVECLVDALTYIAAHTYSSNTTPTNTIALTLTILFLLYMLCAYFANLSSLPIRLLLPICLRICHLRLYVQCPSGFPQMCFTIVCFRRVVDGAGGYVRIGRDCTGIIRHGAGEDRDAFTKACTAATGLSAGAKQ